MGEVEDDDIVERSHSGGFRFGRRGEGKIGHQGMAGGMDMGAHHGARPVGIPRAEGVHQMGEFVDHTNQYTFKLCLVESKSLELKQSSKESD